MISTRRGRNRRSALLAATVAMALVAGACGSDGDDDAADTVDDGATDADSAGDDGGDDGGDDQSDDSAATAAGGADEPADGTVRVRWFVGLGTGSQDEQIDGQNAIVDAFNDSHDDIELVVEYVDNQTASDVLATQIAGGDAPDLIGPVGLAGSNAFAGQYLDLDPLVASSGYDIDQFGDAKDVYRDETGLLGIPFAVFPSAIFYNTDLFDEAGLPYPPAEYGANGITMYGEGTEWEGEWNFEKVEELAQILTVDANGNDATSPDFDATATEQWGYVNQWTEDPAAMGTMFGAGSVVADDGSAQIPGPWVDQWKWYQNMVHGLGVTPDADEAGSDALAGNSFNSGRVAMANTHLWYTCCLADEDGNPRLNWNLAAVPNHDGTVVSKLHGDSFRIHKDTENPEAAFEVLRFLLEDAALDALTVYGAAPARADIRDDYFASLDERFTQDVDWEVIMAGLDYPDVPNHEQNMPNFAEADARIKELGSPLMSEPDFDIDAAVEELLADLNEIFSS